MKKLNIVVILSVGLLVGCNKESNEITSVNEETQASKAAQKQPVTKVFKGEFQSSINPDPSIPPTACSGPGGLIIPGAYFLQGAAIHLGELVSQQSSLNHVSCNLDIGALQLTTVVSGQLAASNGDLIFYSGNDVVDVINFLTGAGPTGSITGTWTITGGTGRFEGASGSFTINGLVDFATTNFNCKAEGTITY